MTNPAIASAIVAPLVWAALIVGTPNVACGQGDFEPFSVFVIQDEAHTRCGPGDDFYRTDPLRHGQQLEVYAETDDGWLGVRPPDGSFCWIPEDATSADPGGQTATIAEDKTVAWIGTQLGRASKYRWQVQLGKGETVSILGRSQREGPDGPQDWLRVVPPSGEFRWIHRDEVAMSSEELVTMVQDPGDGRDREFFPGGPTHIDRPEPIADPSDRVASANDRPRTARRSTADSDFETSGDSVLENRLSTTRRRSGSRRTPERSSDDAIEPKPIGISPGFISQTPVGSGRVGSAMSAPAPPASAAPKTGLLAFLSRPRIADSNSVATASPEPSAGAASGGWIANVLPRISGSSQAIVPTPRVDDSRVLAQVGYEQMLSGAPALPAQTLTPISSMPALPTPAPPTPKVVSAESLAQLRTETARANADELNLILSRLMAAEATSVEIEVVAAAARTAASRGISPLAMDSLRARAESVADVARRSEGVAPQIQPLGSRSLQPSGSLSLQPSGSLSRPHPTTTVPANLASARLPANPIAGSGYPDSGEPVEATVSGTLRQVYSARPGSPPYSLTDSADRTLCYVTPIPGVNLRSHLGNLVTIRGIQGYVTGLSTPHLRADTVIRR